jgi:hypothetical protein
MTSHQPPGAGYPLPRLGEIVRDVERTLRQAINMLGRQYDPASAPQDTPPMTPPMTDRTLGSVVAEIRYALELLGDLADGGLPPAGSAVQYPARQFDTKPRESAGGPPNHRMVPGEDPRSPAGRPTPGPADAATSAASSESPAAPPSRRAGASFTLPVWPGTAELARRINASVAAERGK